MTELRRGTLGAGDLVTDAWGLQKVGMPYSLLSGAWTFDISPFVWFMYENGTQVYTSTDITSTNGVAKLLTTGTNTTLLLESREMPRYQPNRGHLVSLAGWFPNKTNDGVRDFGVFTATNGVFFRLKSDGLLYAVLRSGGVETHEELIDTSTLTDFDVEKNNIYDIQFQWRSAGNYKFFIGDPNTGTSKLVKEFKLLGTLTAPSMENPALPAAFKATRTTADVEMHIGCVDITSEAGKAPTEEYNAAYSEAVSVNGTDHPVIVVQNPLLIGSETNSRTVGLARISVKCSKKATFKVWATRDPSSITGATYKAAVQGSYVATDSTDMDATAVRATAVTTTNMRFITSVPVEALSREIIDNPSPATVSFPIVRGDYLVVTCTPSGNGSADAVIEWGEQI